MLAMMWSIATATSASNTRGSRRLLAHRLGVSLAGGRLDGGCLMSGAFGGKELPQEGGLVGMEGAYVFHSATNCYRCGLALSS